MRICVYCSSSEEIPRPYFELARRLGQEMARRGHELVYGGGNVGLMGEVARAVKAGGGRVYGVMPRALLDYEIGFEQADELVITETVRERKALMDARAEAFLALPGGPGTLEELLEIITLKQLGYHRKAIVIVNGFDYYAPLLEQLYKAVRERFARPSLLELFHVEREPEPALDYIEAYDRPPKPRRRQPSAAEQAEAIG